MLTPKIIFQDKDILMINKPSGLVVNRAESVRVKTLQDWLEQDYSGWDWATLRALKESERTENFINRSGVVHRLDKDTSGVIVVAKNAETFKYLQKQFKERRVIKKYLCLVHDKVEPKIGDIKMPLARSLKDRKKFSVRLGGRASVTNYKVLQVYDESIHHTSFKPRGLKDLKDRRFSLLEVMPKTGRTHQIRVHLKHIGHPIVSDPIYLGKKRLKQDGEWCPRLFLHAQYLSFIHPKTGKRVEFKAKIPKELCLKFLEIPEMLRD